MIGLFFLSGSTTPFPMTTLPRRAARDLRVLCRQPRSPSSVACCFSAAPPRRSRCSRAKAGGDARSPRPPRPAAAAPLPAPTQAQASEFERYWEARERVPLAIPAEGAKVLIVKFNDFQCPPCRNSHLAYKPILAKYEAQNPGAGALRDEGLPARRRVQRQRRQHDSSVGVRAAVAVRLARDAQPRGADDRVALRATSRR